MFTKHKRSVFTTRLSPAQWQKRKVVARDSGIIPGHKLTGAGSSSLSVVVAFSCLGRMELNSGPKSCDCLHCLPFEVCYLHRSLFPFYVFVYLGVWCIVCGDPPCSVFGKHKSLGIKVLITLSSVPQLSSQKRHNADMIPNVRPDLAINFPFAICLVWDWASHVPSLNLFIHV